MKAALIASFAVAVPVLAGPLDQRNIPEDAKWVAHFDLEAGRTSSIGKFVEDNPGVFNWEDPTAEVVAELGLNPFDEIRDVTAYGLSTEDKGIVVLLRGTKKLDDVMDKLVELAKAEAGERDKGGGDEKAGDEKVRYERIEIDGHQVHRWLDEEGAKLAYIGPDPRGKGGRAESRIVVVTQEKDLLRAAIAVIEGDAASLARSEKARLALKPRKGSILCGAAIGLPFIPGSEVAGALAQKADSISLDIGEDDGDFYIDLNLVAKSDTDAMTVSQILQGALALGRIVGSREPDLKELVEVAGHVTFGSEGRSITGRFSYDAARLLEILTAAAEEHEHDDADGDDKEGKPDSRGGLNLKLKRRTRRAE